VGENPTAIRQEIAETREEMGETMEAIGYKTDVGSRAGDYVTDTKDKVTGAVSGAKDSVSSAVSRVVPSREGIKHQSQRVADSARANPIGLAVGSAAVGFLVGLVVPSTRVEDERIGDVADRMKDKLSDAGHEALDRGRAVAQEAKDAAVETVRERGAEETKDLTGSLTGHEGSDSAAEGSDMQSQPERQSAGQSA
jgi:ElaB/YqjD/DUF883 family membrane-anchored ribosome-binding protein